MDFVDKIYDLKLLADKYGLILQHKPNRMEYAYTINDDLCKDKFFGYRFGFRFNDEGRPVELWFPKKWHYDETGHFKVKEYFSHVRGEAENWYDRLLNQTWFWKWKVHKFDKLLNQTIKNCTKIRKKRKEEDIKLIAIKGDQEFVAKKD